MSYAFVVREGDPYDHGAEYVAKAEQRLLEILDYVDVCEELPDLSNAELDKLVGEEGMIRECHCAYIRNIYKLTEYGQGELKRLQTERKKPIYTFVTDKPNGGMIVECSVCEGQFDTPNSLDSVPQFQTQHTCPHCKTDVVYPDGASW